MKNILPVFLFLMSTCLLAQNKTPGDSKALRSVNGIVKEMLRLVSGEKGKSRNFEAFRNLFLPTANFTVVNHGDSLLQPVETVSLEEFIKLMQDQYYEDGFLEHEISKVVNEYNGMANVFQSFYGRDSENSKARGINNYQLVYYNNRWWIANIVWTIETGSARIPGKYLHH